MAAEQTEVVQGSGNAEKGGVMRAAGIAAGFFMLMLISQLVGPMLACMIMPGAAPGCADIAPAGTETEEAQNKEPPQYLALDPPLVVSFEDRSAIRFLQVTVEVMARDEEAIEAVQTHSPVIRNNLLMLLGGQSLTDLTSREGKERLRQESLVEVQRILTENTGKPGIEDLYFTGFVVQ